MTKLRKRWPRQRRAFRVIVPAGGGCRGPCCADPAGRARRGNPHSLRRGRGPRLPRLSAGPRWALETVPERGSLRAEGGRDQRSMLGDAERQQSRQVFEARGLRGTAAAQPAPPSLPFPRPPPGAPAPRPSACGSRMSAPSALPRCSSKLAAVGGGG